MENAARAGVPETCLKMTSGLFCMPKTSDVAVNDRNPFCRQVRAQTRGFRNAPIVQNNERVLTPIWLDHTASASTLAARGGSAIANPAPT